MKKWEDMTEEEREAERQRIITNPEMQHCRIIEHEGSRAVWASKGPIPEKGTRIAINFNGWGKATVKDHIIEQAYFYALAQVDKIPESFKARGHDGLVYVAGVDFKLLEEA